MCDGLTVSFEIRYVDGADGTSVAAAQADAISALLNWLANRDDATRHVGLSDVDETIEGGRTA